MLTPARIDELLVLHGKGDDGFHAFARAIEADILAAHTAAASAQDTQDMALPIADGYVHSVPFDNFTLYDVRFWTQKVPIGTRMYTEATVRAALAARPPAQSNMSIKSTDSPNVSIKAAKTNISPALGACPCKYCGQASYVDPSDQQAPADVCHPEDHGTASSVHGTQDAAPAPGELA